MKRGFSLGLDLKLNQKRKLERYYLFFFFLAFLAFFFAFFFFAT